MTEAAPIAPEILEFFYACGVPVLEGWGMTETTAVGTVATLDHFKFGTVGASDAGGVRIADEDARSSCAGRTSFGSTGANLGDVRDAGRRLAPYR